MRPPLLGFLFLVITFPALAVDEAVLWHALRSGSHIALMRHAIAPGVGDPEEFVLDDCGTQRNLSDAGRAQSRLIGDRFRRNGINAAAVFSSQWCRCLETAKLLNLGTVQALPMLNSFFRQFQRQTAQTEDLENWLAARYGERPAVLVTHQVNITALSGVYPSSGEIVVVKKDPAGKVAVLGTIETN